MGTLYALLVGINEYEDPQRNLTGCLKDVEAMSQYLTAAIPDKDRRKIEQLTEDGATRKAVTEHLATFYKDAGPEDTVLIYYSGHGCQEDAHTALKRFTGNKIEALVCHDSIHTHPPLADMEIRYLLHKIAGQTGGARIIFITDSCNSGGVSRDISAARPRLGPFAKMRDWNQFFFAKAGDHVASAITEAAVNKASSLDELLPQAHHVHIAACESSQSAFELTGYQGIFTANLVNVLRDSRGTITFGDLHGRLRYLVRRRFSQNPQIYAYQGGNLLEGRAIGEDLLNAEFLKGTGAGNRVMANVHYISGAWVVDRGQIHGMPPTEEAKKLAADEELGIDIVNIHSGEVLSKGEIVEVRPGDTTFSPDSPFDLEPEDHLKYKADIKGLYLEPLDVFPTGTGAAGIQAFQHYANNEANAEKLAARGLRIASDRTGAECQVIAYEEEEDGEQWQGYMITSPRDPEDPVKARPLCRQIQGWDVPAVELLTTYLGKIAHWHFVRRLHNRKPQIDLLSALEWEVFYQPGLGRIHNGRMVDEEEDEEKSFNPDLDEQGVPIKDQQAYRTMEIQSPPPPEGSMKWPYVRLRLRLHNASPFKLYISLIYLGQRFEVMSQTVNNEPKVVEMTPGKTVWGIGNSTTGTVLPMLPFIKEDNWEDQTIFFKLIVSTTPYELGNSLDQTPLPPPGAGKKGAASKDISQSVSLAPPVKDWMSKMVELRVQNPFYEKKGME